LPPAGIDAMLNVKDLFCGMGGLSYGFYKAGFNVTGYDVSKYSPGIFEKNRIHGSNRYESKIFDLEKRILDFNSDIIIGGPPCKPWSSVNVTRRGRSHPDYGLVDSYFYTVYRNRPPVFLMENVPPVGNSEPYNRWFNVLLKTYDIQKKICSYNDFGAASKRKRLITIGLNREVNDRNDFFSILNDYKKNDNTVWKEIGHLSKYGKGEFPDHVWPNLKTIHKYKKYYETGKYGWYILKRDEPAPSFGNVMKTYTLHPDGHRAISVREVMAIMGFPDNYTFPEGIGHTVKYQMIADVVSPIFSYACARAMKKMLKHYV